ncbi:MAG: hypothetical protein ACRD2T_03045 [Thermoanaerobaculia bacterium]
MQQHLWLVFVVGAALSWGAYGPALHHGQSAFPERATASLRSLFCVGVSYFLVGVLVPLAALGAQGKLAGFSSGGVLFSTAAGALGALGAVCIIWAFKNGGTPLAVMPLVFAGAPVINAAISMAQHPTPVRNLHPLLFVGFGCAALGGWLVLHYKP